MSLRAPILSAAAVLAAALLTSPASPRADEGDLRAMTVELAEFAIGAPLGDADRRRLSALVAGQADRDPASRAGTEKAMAAVLSAISQSRDDAARAAIRRTLVTRLYWDLRSKPDPVAQLIVDRAGVLAAVEQTRVVVRRADVEAVCRSAALGRDEAGEDFDQAACRENLSSGIGKLSSLAPEGQELMASGERRAIILEHYWRAMPREKRAESLAAAKRRAGSDEPLRIGRALETSALAARLDARLERFGDAAADGLAKGATAARIGAAAQGF